MARAVELALRWRGPGAVVLNVGTGRNHSAQGMLYPLSSIRHPPSAIHHPPSTILYPLSTILYPLSAIRPAARDSYVRRAEAWINPPNGLMSDDC